MKKFVLSLLINIFLFGVVIPSHAEIYRWVDKDGKIHFSDEKPPEAQADLVTPAIADPAPEPDVGELRRRRYLESANEPRYSPTVATQSYDAGHVDVQQCRQARVEYGILEEPVPAYRTDTGELRAHWFNDTHRGNRAYIADDQRDAEKDAAWARMNRYCEDADDQTAYVDTWNDYVDDVYCNEYRVKLERARERRSKTPRNDLVRMEEEYRENCG
jgi:hypothetical protein